MKSFFGSHDLIRRNDMKKIGLTILLLTSVLSYSCKDKIGPGTGKVDRPQISGIAVETVQPSSVDEYYETSGTVKAKTVSAVASRIMGTVTAVKVKEGDKVAAGQILLTVDDRDILQKVEGAKEGHREAEKALEAADENRKMVDITYQRYKRLYDDKALTGQEFDQIKTQKNVADIDYERARAAVKRAEAGLKEAKVFHGFSRVVSPVSGIVTDKRIELGSMAVPGNPLLTVEDNSSYRIEINADERFAGRIRPGTEASVTAESAPGPIRGTVTEVVPSVDPASRTFLVKIAIKDGGLRNGSYVKVSLPVGRKDALLVPSRTVVERGQLTGIYVVGGDSVIRYRLVKAGRKYGDSVENLSGLKPMDRVVVEGVEKAVDGGVALKAGEK